MVVDENIEFYQYKFIEDNVNFYLQNLKKQSFLVLNNTHLKTHLLFSIS